ncbi:MAG TPA: lytic transglycosylase domain-containing protein [Burkholderiaceae bacterium]|jgi:Transglycosylase SLT domain|nr:lytic transglycosylase domain-containing protein [Burkholderiaceae bacterium]
MSTPASLTAIYRACVQSAGTFARDVGTGLLEVSHNSLAIVGLAVVCGTVLFSAARPDLREGAEQRVLGWLLARQEARQAGDAPPEPANPDAAARVAVADLSSLSKQQASVATWLARRYRVAVEPVSRLVQEAWDSGQRAGVDPTLVLAIIAIESSFNPFAQSSMGAQGLMQVMTRIHDEKYERFGGSRAAFDPVSNLRVGVQVLKECISRAGSLEGGLKYYVGAANFADDGGYAGKVLAEQTNLRRVADGKWVSVYVTLPSTTNPTPIDAKNVSPEPGPGAEAPKSSDTDKVAWVRSTR